MIGGLAPLNRAGPHELTFLDNAKYADGLRTTRAGACLISERFAADAPASLPLLVTREPYRAFVAVARALYPEALRPSSLFEAEGVAPGAYDPSDRAAGKRRDRRSRRGHRSAGRNRFRNGDRRGRRDRRECEDRPRLLDRSQCLDHACADRRPRDHPCRMLHRPGRIRLFAWGRRGHVKVPQVGRVIIQDDVEIGAGTAIDRGAIRDTVIGEGTKIDNHVQIAHNVSIGRHCVIVAQSGIAGSSTLGDYVDARGAVGGEHHIRRSAKAPSSRRVASSMASCRPEAAMADSPRNRLSNGFVK